MTDDDMPPPGFNSDHDDFDNDEEVKAPRTMPAGVRFGSGQKANSKGRPKLAGSRKEMVARVAAKRTKVEMNGHSQRLDYLTIALHRLVVMAASGELRAMRLHEQMIADLAPHVVTGENAVLFLPERLVEEEWMDHVKPDAKIRRSREFMAIMGESLRNVIGEDEYTKLLEGIKLEEVINMRRLAQAKPVS